MCSVCLLFSSKSNTHHMYFFVLLKKKGTKQLCMDMVFWTTSIFISLFALTGSQIAWITHVIFKGVRFSTMYLFFPYVSTISHSLMICFCGFNMYFCRIHPERKMLTLFCEETQKGPTRLQTLGPTLTLACTGSRKVAWFVLCVRWWRSSSWDQYKAQQHRHGRSGALAFCKRGMNSCTDERFAQRFLPDQQTLSHTGPCSPEMTPSVHALHNLCLFIHRDRLGVSSSLLFPSQFFPLHCTPIKKSHDIPLSQSLLLYSNQRNKFLHGQNS